ncbi:MAG TPA: hypothetical protein VK525_00365 [Candidatus Saccharimonadales bacterium]|nr:hypothetical protein [Candidatus Saccharimonadales bacterium]
MRARLGTLLSLAVTAVALLGLPAHSDGPEQNWTHFVRIGGYGLNSKSPDKIVRDAEASHVFGIEVDNDIPGRYESFLDPTAKLADIRAVAEKAHLIKNKAFVYIAGTECITANADKSPHSVVKDHPDWLQRKLTGEPAVFTSGAAFWIRKGDEDVWISPYAQPWRKTYMERVRQIAATGIDGIYVDIPYWMTHFDGWENTWASFDDFTVAAFKAKTGLNARKDLKIGDFSDGNFRKWVNFRIDTLTDFVAEIRSVARSVNPAIMVIPEIYPGIEQEATRVGADVYEMYAVVDAIAHEYEFGSGDHMAAGRTQVDWFLYQAGMLTFRAFAEGKASWILNYSWDGDKGVAAREAMKTLAASQIVTGVNFWDAPGHSMGGSNDLPTRTEIFKWIAAHEKTFYLPRTPIHPIGVYFSPASRNFDSEHFLPAYRGTLVLLLQRHLEFQPVTPRTLAGFKGASLVLPDVSVLSDDERSQLKAFVGRGGKLVITGADNTALGAAGNIERFATSPGATHLAALQNDFAKATASGQPEFIAALPQDASLVVQTAPTVASSVSLVDGKPHVFLANFGGIVPHSNVNPAPETATRISVPASRKCTARFLPFLGEERELKGTVVGDRLIFYLPAVDRAAVVWITDAR